MTVNYIDAVDQNVASVTLYAKDTSDGYIYADAACTENVNRETLLGLCIKGLVLVLYKSVYYKPVYFKDSAGTVTLTIATTISASASATLDLKSKEPAAA